MRLIKSTRGRVLELTGFRTVAQFARAVGLSKAEAEAGVVASYNQEIIAQRVVMREARRIRTNAQARARRAAKRAAPLPVIGAVLFHSDTPVDDNTVQLLYNAIELNRGKMIVLVHVGDGERKVMMTERIPVDDARIHDFIISVKDVVMRNSEISHFQWWTWNYVYQTQSVTLYESTIINPRQIKQYFRDGVEHCMLQPVLNWARDKLATIATDNRGKFRYSAIVKKCDQFISEYEEGLPEDKVQHVCNALQIDIDVVSPFHFNLKNDHVFSVKCDKKRLKKFTFMNTRVNHVDCIANTGGIVQASTAPQLIAQDEMVSISKELDKTRQFYTFTRGKLGMTRINTINSTYELEDEYKPIVREHEATYKLDDCKICDFKNRDLSDFVREGVHYNACVDFKNTIRVNVANLTHIDMEKAYTQSHECKFYAGFLGRITDFRKTDKIQGVGIYLISNLDWSNAEPTFMLYNAKMKIYPVHSTHRVKLPSPEIDMLTSMGVKFDISAGAWGVSPIDMQFSSSMLRKDSNGLPHYARWSGACDSHPKDNKFYMKTTNKELIQLAMNNNKYVEASIFEYSNGNGGEACIRFPKTSNLHLSHITAFITSYQRLNVIEQLMTMDINAIYRVCVDGIYYKGATDIPLCNAFRLKNEPDEKTLANDAGDEFMSNTYYGDDDAEDDAEYDAKISPARESHRVEMHRGEGGSGKTHMNLMDNGFQRVLYVAPSYKLAAAKAQYGCDTAVIANVIGANTLRTAEVNRYSSVLVVDEVSMLTNECVKCLMERYPTHKIILCGDLGYQLPPIKGEAFNPTDFEKTHDIHIVTHDKDYRCACPALRRVKKDLRAFIDTKASANTIMSYLREALPTITNAELAENYQLEDMILAGTNAMKDNYTSLVANKFEGKNKYYVTENTREYHNGDIIIGDKPTVKCDIRHCFTVHSVQGETAEHNLYLDTKTMLTPTHIYTAVSRARKIDQIYLVDCNMDRYDGKIYKIVSSMGVYVGSTITTLDARLKGHIASKVAYEKDNTKKRLTSFPLLDDGKIELIESFKCDTQSALLIRESEIIKSMDCVNKTYNQ